MIVKHSYQYLCDCERSVCMECVSEKICVFACVLRVTTAPAIGEAAVRREVRYSCHVHIEDLSWFLLKLPNYRAPEDSKQMCRGAAAAVLKRKENAIMLLYEKKSE